MRTEPYKNVFGSTLNDLTHKGPLQAGNKSLLAYRSEHGVPGYTGFIPGNATILIPSKGSTIHTGRQGDARLQDEMAKTTFTSGAKASEYADRYQADRSNYRRPEKEGGGYWIDGRVSPSGPTFNSTTTYRAEILDAEATTAAQLAKSYGLMTTISGYETARQRAQTAEPSMRTTRTNRFGEVAGYQTTYNSMVVTDPITGGPAAAGAQRRPATVVGFRYRVMPAAMAPSFEGTTMYTQNMGLDGSDPQERSAPNETFQSRMASTAELAEGTRRNTHNLPAYTGHVPASKYSGLGGVHANGEKRRVNAKNDMLLHHLDQYSRRRLPLYGGYKPQAGVSVTSEQPSQGPTVVTTYGAANFDATSHYNPTKFPTDGEFHNDSKEGIMKFFTAGKDSVSDNGLTNAQLYYKGSRPLGGLFKIASPDIETAYGARFKSSNSLV